MRTADLALTCCYRCSAHLVMEPGVARGLQARGADILCGKCEPVVAAGREALPCLPGRRCVHERYQRGPFAELVIEEVKGDQVRVMVLGHPGRRDLADMFWPPAMRGREVFARAELIMRGP